MCTTSSWIVQAHSYQSSWTGARQLRLKLASESYHDTQIYRPSASSWFSRSQIAFCSSGSLTRRALRSPTRKSGSWRGQAFGPDSLHHVWNQSQSVKCAKSPSFASSASSGTTSENCAGLHSAWKGWSWPSCFKYKLILASPCHQVLGIELIILNWK